MATHRHLLWRLQSLFNSHRWHQHWPLGASLTRRYHRFSSLEGLAATSPTVAVCSISIIIRIVIIIMRNIHILRTRITTVTIINIILHRISVCPCYHRAVAPLPPPPLLNRTTTGIIMRPLVVTNILCIHSNIIIMTPQTQLHSTVLQHLQHHHLLDHTRQFVSWTIMSHQWWWNHRSHEQCPKPTWWTSLCPLWK